MSGAVIMKEPVCLVESDKEGNLRVDPAAQDILNQIDQHVVVVAVVGLYRTGKSYLMNKLAGKNKGFALGSTIQAKTKGIWMWCVPHPLKADHTLVLLDTEGLGDVEKGDDKNDNWIFSLAVLLSSTLVYNSMGTIDNKALENLHYVTELTKHIKVKSGQKEDESAEYIRFFPSFVWTVRDFTLELELDGKAITADEYLENALKLKPDPTQREPKVPKGGHGDSTQREPKVPKGGHGDSTQREPKVPKGGHGDSTQREPKVPQEGHADSTQRDDGTSQKILEYNLPRECLRNYFSPRWCFVFDRPANREKMRRMEQLTDADLEPDFVQQSKNFCTHIFTKSKTKTLKGGILVTGRLLGNLAETYVATIRSGQIPCLDNAVLALSEIENASAVKRATVFYQQNMASFVAFPTESQEELSEIHAQIEKQALAIFMKSSFKDENQKFQIKLMEVLQAEYQQIIEKNFQESKKVCETLIKRVFGPLEEKGSSAYAVPGGYNKYCSDIQTMTKEYKDTKGKGVKAEEVLIMYMDRLTNLGQIILAADKSLSEAEQRAKEEEARREQAEQERHAAQEQDRMMKILQEEQERTHQLHITLLKEKMKSDMEAASAEYQRVMDAKLKEKEYLSQNGFHEKAQRVEREIEDLKEQFEKEMNENKAFLKMALKNIRDAAMNIGRAISTFFKSFF